MFLFCFCILKERYWYFMIMVYNDIPFCLKWFSSFKYCRCRPVQSQMLKKALMNTPPFFISPTKTDHVLVKRYLAFCQTYHFSKCLAQVSDTVMQLYWGIATLKFTSTIIICYFCCHWYHGVSYTLLTKI